MDLTSSLLNWLLLRSPLLLLTLVGIIVALVRWKRHPVVSFLTLLGLCFWQLESFAFLLVRVWLPDWARQYGWTNQSLGNAFFALNLTQDFFYSAVLILLVAAAF